LYVSITDDLDADNPGYLEYVDQSATLNGLAAGVTFAGTTITADYFNQYGPLAPGEDVILRFRAVINPNLVDGTPISNTADVTWNDPLQTANATAVIDVGGVPGAGILSGAAWHDADFTNTLEPGERALEGWTVTLLRAGQPIRSVLTDADGNYVIPSVIPNYISGEPYSLVFRAPGAGARARRDRLRLHRRPAAHRRHRGAGRQQPARPQPADRPERRGLRFRETNAGA
jgi:hypothetical protein